MKITVKGKVQGVGFRYYTKLKADELGLSGSVQNLSDGSVEIYAHGEKKLINTFIKWCHIGSPASKVNEVVIDHIPSQLASQSKPKTNRSSFLILRL